MRFIRPTQRTLGAILAAVLLAITGITLASAASGAGGTASDYVPLSSTRVLDTRTGLGTVQAGAISAKTIVAVAIPGIPADATAVTVNLTVVSPTGNGYIMAYAANSTPPTTGSNINWTVGQTVANQATVPVNNGRVFLDVQGNGTTQIIMDLEGYFTASAPAYTPPNTLTGTADIGADGESVNVGGNASGNALDVIELTLPAGTYQVSVNAKAAPSAPTGTVQTFPSFFVYNQAIDARFDGDLLNIGGTPLESGANNNIDSYFSGSGLVTVNDTTELHVYAFGYNSDRSGGSYTLEGLNITAVPVTVAAS
jgi:hypothetical protein